MSNDPATKTVAVTRAGAQTETLRTALADSGFELLAIPTIGIEPPADPEALRQAGATLADYAWVVLTSANAVRALVAVRRPPWPTGVRVATIGRGTAKVVEEAGQSVDFVPTQENGAGLVAELGGQVAGQRLLLPLSSIARRPVPDGLRAAGALVDEVVAYRTVPDQDGASRLRAAIATGTISVLVVTSPSSALALAGTGDDFDRLTAGVALVSIGGATSATLRQLGRPADVEAAAPGPAGLAAAIRSAGELPAGGSTR